MAFLRYTLLRTLLLLVTGAVLYLLGMRGVLLLLAALLLSGLVSVVALRGVRGQASEALAGRLTSIRQRMDERTTAEDAWDDAHRGPAGPDDLPGSAGPGGLAGEPEPPPPPGSTPDGDGR